MTDIANSKDFANGWIEVNRRLKRIKDTHPWECGQLLLDDVHFGLLSQRASDDLRVLTKVTRHHYVQQPGFTAWRDLARNIATYKGQSEVCTAQIFWSERSAYEALENLAAAGQHLVLGEVEGWQEKMAEAYLCAAEYLGEIAIATAASEKSTRSALPAGRLRDIADSMACMVEAEAARLKSNLDIYRSQISALDAFVSAKNTAIQKAERERVAAEQARVAAMPRLRRIFYHVGQVFANSAG